MQMSAMKACFQIAECSLSSAKIMQMSAMKACFQIAECSLSYAKIRIFSQRAYTRFPENITIIEDLFHSAILEDKPCSLPILAQYICKNTKKIGKVRIWMDFIYQNGIEYFILSKWYRMKMKWYR